MGLQEFREIQRTLPAKKASWRTGGLSPNRDPDLGRGLVYNIGFNVTRTLPTLKKMSPAEMRSRPQEEVTLKYIGLSRFSLFKRLEEHRDNAAELNSIKMKGTPWEYETDRYTEEFSAPKIEKDNETKDKFDVSSVQIMLRVAMGPNSPNTSKYDRNMAEPKVLATSSLFTLGDTEKYFIGGNYYRPNANTYFDVAILNSRNTLNRSAGGEGVNFTNVSKQDMAMASYIYLTEEISKNTLKNFLYNKNLNPEFQAAKAFTALYKLDPKFLNIQKPTEEFERIKKEVRDYLVRNLFGDTVYQTVITTLNVEGGYLLSGLERQKKQDQYLGLNSTSYTKEHLKEMDTILKDLVSVFTQEISFMFFLDPGYVKKIDKKNATQIYKDLNKAKDDAAEQLANLIVTYKTQKSQSLFEHYSQSAQRRFKQNQDKGKRKFLIQNIEEYKERIDTPRLKKEVKSNIKKHL